MPRTLQPWRRLILGIVLLPLLAPAAVADTLSLGDDVVILNGDDTITIATGTGLAPFNLTFDDIGAPVLNGTILDVKEGERTSSWRLTAWSPDALTLAGVPGPQTTIRTGAQSGTWQLLGAGGDPIFTTSSGPFTLDSSAYTLTIQRYTAIVRPDTPGGMNWFNSQPYTNDAEDEAKAKAAIRGTPGPSPLAAVILLLATGLFVASRQNNNPRRRK